MTASTIAMQRMNPLWLAIALFLAAACDDGGGADRSWTALLEDEPAALLSVWGASPQDVWVVGGDGRDGSGPAVLHWDGSAWARLDSGQRNVDLWWVFGFDAGPVFMGGSNGVILRYSAGEFEAMETPGTRTVFGIWGARPDDVWAVGGSLGGGAGGGFAWHYDGTTWTPDPSIPAPIAEQGTVWKVSGRAEDDIWMTGTAGFAAHWTGAELQPDQVPIDASLFSVASAPDRFVAVGGDFGGAVYENDGSGWDEANLPEGTQSLSGVAAGDAAVYAVGREGTVLRRTPDGWELEPTGATIEDLHAAFIDPEGGVWIVGGQFETPITASGVLMYSGPQSIAPGPNP